MDIAKNVILAPYTTFKIGGPADYFIVAKNTEELVNALKWAEDPSLHSGKKLPVFVLGTGANILIGDKGFRGLVIKNEASSVILSEQSESKDLYSPNIDSSTALGMTLAKNEVLLEAEGGITIKKLIDLSIEKGLTGIEHFAGIPSTLGGALWQNLHFLSSDRSRTVFISEVLENAQILDKDLNLKEVDRNYFKFDYDYSILHDTHEIVLSAVLKLRKENPEIIKERVENNLKWRTEKHPYQAWKNSAGSIFKKIEGSGAGRLIEKVGLKGHKIGGAQISGKHANFIINTGNAKASDVLALIKLIQEKVKNELKLDLKTEISLVGEF